jgi:hypothetical protein
MEMEEGEERRKREKSTEPLGPWCQTENIKTTHFWCRNLITHTHTHIHTNGAEPSKAIFYLKKKKIKRKEKSKAPPSSFPGLPFCLSKWVLIKKFTSSLYSAWMLYSWPLEGLLHCTSGSLAYSPGQPWRGSCLPFLMSTTLLFRNRRVSWPGCPQSTAVTSLRTKLTGIPLHLQCPAEACSRAQQRIHPKKAQPPFMVGGRHPISLHS